MDNKTILISIIVIVILALGGWWLYAAMANPANQNSGNQTGSNANQAKGTVYVSVADAAVNMGAVTAVNMTIDKVYLHSQTQGWVTVSQDPQTFSLLALKASGNSGLMAKVDVAADTYDQAWFHVSHVMVTESGKLNEATLPSNDFKINGIVKVMANTTSTAKFDVMADQSLHKTAAAEFIFAPVVKFESRSNATVSVDTNNLVTITDGNVDSDKSAGMDIDGQVKDNFKIDANANLEINGGVINLKGAAAATGTVNLGY